MTNNDTTNTETGNIRWLIRHKLSTVPLAGVIDEATDEFLSHVIDYMAISQAVEDSFQVFGLTDDLNMVALDRVMSRIQTVVDSFDDSNDKLMASCLTQKDVFKLIEERASDLVRYIDAFETDLYALKQRIGCHALKRENE